jgi:hypothetical protein
VAFWNQTYELKLKTPNYKYDNYTRDLEDTSFDRCLHNQPFSGCAMRFTTGSFWVCTEVSTVLRAVAVELFFNFSVRSLTSGNPIGLHGLLLI